MYLRRISVHKELYNLNSSPNIIRVIKSSRMTWARHVARMREMKNEYKIFVSRPGMRRPCGRTRHRKEDNIRTNLREIGWTFVDWMHLAFGKDQWWAVVNMAMNISCLAK
jgi:hypothetical protein